MVASRMIKKIVNHSFILVSMMYVGAVYQAYYDGALKVYDKTINGKEYRIIENKGKYFDIMEESNDPNVFVPFGSGIKPKGLEERKFLEETKKKILDDL